MAPWDNSRSKLSDVLRALAKIGYAAVPYDPESAEGIIRAYPVVTPSQKRWLFSDRKWDDTPDFGIMKAIR
ncbi:MAG: hypothetical protein Q8P42_11495 [Gallionella sp.]|nr:hypothetical protein [Gallionella sp.]